MQIFINHGIHNDLGHPCPSRLCSLRCYQTERSPTEVIQTHRPSSNRQSSKILKLISNGEFLSPSKRVNFLWRYIYSSLSPCRYMCLSFSPGPCTQAFPHQVHVLQRFTSRSPLPRHPCILPIITTSATKVLAL